MVIGEFSTNQRLSELFVGAMDDHVAASTHDFVRDH